MTRIAFVACLFVAAILGSVRGFNADPAASPNPSSKSNDDVSSSWTSACGHDASRPLVKTSGIITHGSGPEGFYLPETNCTWVIAPQRRGKTSTNASTHTPPNTITLVFEKFATVLDDDFLFVTDASSDQLNDESNTPLAAYTGSLPTPIAVRFDVEALRLNFVTKRNNRDAGFRVRYDANACDDDKNDNKTCGGRGACYDGLCVCDDNWTGPVCEVPVPSLPTDGTQVSGIALVGTTKWFRIEIPPAPLGASPENKINDVVVTLTFPNGATGAKPLLTVADATRGVNGVQSVQNTKITPSTPTTPSTPPTHYSTYQTLTNGSCGSTGEMCGWRMDTTESASPPLDVSPNVRIAGPTAAYRLGGTSLLEPTPFGIRDILLPALPTFDYHHRKAIAHWSLGNADRHELRLIGDDEDSNEDLNQSFGKPSESTETPLTNPHSLPSTGSVWVVGVSNTGEKPLTHMLAGTRRGGEPWWGPRPGFESAERPVQFVLQARAINSPNDACDGGECAAGNGACVDGTCRCRTRTDDETGESAVESSVDAADAVDATTTSATATPLVLPYGFQVRGRCVAPVVADLQNGVASSPFVVRVGQWVYTRVLLPPGTESHELVIEMSHPESPEASLAMFVARDGWRAQGDSVTFESVPTLTTKCAAFGNGAGPFGDERCVPVDVKHTAFRTGSRDALRVLTPSNQKIRNAQYSTLTTVLDVMYDFARVVIPPEAHREFTNVSTNAEQNAYTIAVWNPPGASVDDALEVRLRTSFFPIQSSNSGSGESQVTQATETAFSRCPFDCSGTGTCEFFDARDGTSTSTSSTPIVTTSDNTVPDASSFRQTTTRCLCPANTTGAYCQSPLLSLPLTGEAIAGRLATGAWDVYELDVGDVSSSKQDPESLGVLVELRRGNTSRDAFPMVFVKRGAPPAAFEAVFVDETLEAEVVFDPSTNGVSVSGLGTPGNSVVHVDLPPGARVIGVKYDLKLSANAPSLASEACFGFETTYGYVAAACFSNTKASGVFKLTGNTVTDDALDAPDVVFDVPEVNSNNDKYMEVETDDDDENTSDDNDNNASTASTSSPTKQQFTGGIAVELFEGYDDAIWGDGGRARVVSRTQNASREIPDATWAGTLTFLYHPRLGTGFDYRDVSSSFCNGKDCAVADDHSVFFPLEEIQADEVQDTDDSSEDSSSADSSPVMSPVPASSPPKKIFVGVYNSRAVSQPGWLGGTLSKHESGRFSKPMEYTLSASVSSIEEPQCLNDCGRTTGNGSSTKGMSLSDAAPVCDCAPGYFGAGCGIDPGELPLGEPSDGGISSKTTALPEGHFAYFKLTVPLTQKSLTVTLQHPAHDRSFPRVFLKRDTIPVFCNSAVGAASGCADDFDAQASFAKNKRKIVWSPSDTDSDDADGSTYTTTGISVLTSTVEPRSRNGVQVGAPGRETADADALAAELNRRSAMAGFDDANAQHSSDEKSDATDADWTRSVLPPDGSVNPVGSDPADYSTWYLAVYNDPFEGKGVLRFSVSGSVSSEAACPSTTCGGDGKGRCDTSTGSCVCEPGFFGATCTSRLTELATHNDETATLNITDGLDAGSSTFVWFEIKCKGVDVYLSLAKIAAENPEGKKNQSTVFTSDPFPDVYDTLIAVRRGEAPHIAKGEYLAGAVLAPGDGDAGIEITNAEPGVYFVSVRRDGGGSFMETSRDDELKRDTKHQPLVVSLEVTASTAPNPYNNCTHAHGRLLVQVTSYSGDDTSSSGDDNDGTNSNKDDSDPNSSQDSTSIKTKTFELLGPDPVALFDDSKSDGAPVPFLDGNSADVYEPSFGVCGPSVDKTCYLGDTHSSGRVEGLSPNSKGHGVVTGRLVLAKSTPLKNDQAFRYDFGDARKKQIFDGEDSSSSEISESSIFSIGVPNAASNVDLEACGPLLNPNEIKGSVCLAVRGGCFFSTKTLACQNAGAVAVVLVNTNREEGASDAWVGSHEPGDITIPTLSVSLETGNRLLREMMMRDDGDTDNGTQKTSPSKPSWSYSNPVTLTASAYECVPSVFCPECAPGFLSRESNCTSTKCPGMNSALSLNCSGHGVGEHGGCSVGDNEKNGTMTCACAEGYAGPACDVRTTTSAYDEALRRAEAERNADDTVSVDVLSGVVTNTSQDTAVVAASTEEVEVPSADGTKFANVSLAVTGFVILLVALVLAAAAAVVARRRVKNQRTRLDVERHIQETGGI